MPGMDAIAPDPTPLARILRIPLFLLPGVLACAVLWAWGRIPQPLGYHGFSDQRALLNIPHALNVLSNVPFFVVGAWGLWFLFRGGRSGVAFQSPAERWPFAVMFL